MAVIYLIRHGQASWGKRDYDNLTDTGIEQARILGRTLRARIGKPDQVIVGGMRRHRQTADYALEAMGMRPAWQEDHRWNEYDHMQLLSKLSPFYRSQLLMMLDMARSLRPRQKVQVLLDRALARWISGEFDADYSESWSAFKARVEAAREEAVSHAGTTLVFTSGGAKGAAVCSLWGAPDASWLEINRVIANCSITKLIRGRQGLHLSTFNEHSHFEGETRSLLTFR